jgi:hypothetical protein
MDDRLTDRKLHVLIGTHDPQRDPHRELKFTTLLPVSQACSTSFARTIGDLLVLPVLFSVQRNSITRQFCKGVFIRFWRET